MAAQLVPLIVKLAMQKDVKRVKKDSFCRIVALVQYVKMVVWLAQMGIIVQSAQSAVLLGQNPITYPVCSQINVNHAMDNVSDVNI